MENAGLLIGLQVFSKILTFSLNQLLVRYTKPSNFGVAFVQLELFLSVLLFIAREPIRSCLIRVDLRQLSKSTAKRRMQQFVNIGFLPVAIGSVIAVVTLALWLMFTDISPFILGIYTATALVELAVEPVYLLLVSLSLYKTRVAVEAWAIGMKCLTAALIAVSIDGDSLLPFPCSQIAYAMTLSCGYLYVQKKTLPVEMRSVRPVISKPLFNKQDLAISKSFMGQSIVKFLLQEGDKFVLTALSSSHDQGVYALVNNYGSLVVRMLFLPIEEASRRFFGQHQSSKPQLCKQYLETLLKIYIYFAMFLICFGSQFAGLLVSALTGPLWSSSNISQILSIYCFLIPLFGLNGITEAFVQAVASTVEIHQMTVWMSVFSLVYYALAVAFTLHPVLLSGSGIVGILLANGVNMAMRIAWSLRFIKQRSAFEFFKFPFEIIFLVFPLAAFAVHLVTITNASIIIKFFIGGILALLCLFFM